MRRRTPTPCRRRRSRTFRARRESPGLAGRTLTAVELTRGRRLSVIYSFDELLAGTFDIGRDFWMRPDFPLSDPDAFVRANGPERVGTEPIGC